MVEPSIDHSSIQAYQVDTKSRFHFGLAAYILLGVLAGLTLDGKIRIATWVFLSGLALKSFINHLQQH